MIIFQKIVRRKNIIVLSGVIISFMVAAFAFAHGPKGHSGGDFNTLQAAKKGVILYDRLVSSGKLEESWETELASIEIFKKNNGKQMEFVVKFNRSESEPQTVFIFFSGDGQYKGSNFTGK
jgi:hypothetical protein